MRPHGRLRWRLILRQLLPDDASTGAATISLEDYCTLWELAVQLKKSGSSDAEIMVLERVHARHTTNLSEQGPVVTLSADAVAALLLSRR